MDKRFIKTRRVYKYTKVEGVMKVQTEIIGDMMLLFVAVYLFCSWFISNNSI